MKAILKFDVRQDIHIEETSEDWKKLKEVILSLDVNAAENDDVYTLKDMIQATSMSYVLFRLKYNFYKEITWWIDGKYKDGKTDLTPYDVLEEIMERIHSIIGEAGVHVD